MISYNFKGASLLEIQWKILDFDPAPIIFYHKWPTVLQRIPFSKFEKEVNPGLPFPLLANEVFDWNFVKANEGIIIIKGDYNDSGLGKLFQLLRDQPPIIWCKKFCNYP